MTARRDSQVQSTEKVPGERARAHWIGGYNINGRNKNGLLSRHNGNQIDHRGFGACRGDERVH
jgi:hypothetical protein